MAPRYRIDLSTEDRTDLGSFISFCWFQDMEVAWSMKPDTNVWSEAMEDADAEDMARGRLDWAEHLTASELLRYVRIIEEVPPEHFESPEIAAKRDAVAARIRKLVRDAKAERAASQRSTGSTHSRD